MNWLVVFKFGPAGKCQHLKFEFKRNVHSIYEALKAQGLEVRVIEPLVTPAPWRLM